MNDLQIEKYRHDLAYLRAMAEQTIRDFERFNYTIVFKEELPVSFLNFQLQLAEQLTAWCKFDAERIPGLLSHIDIPEHKIPARFGCRDTYQLAGIILQRELIKVILKKHYSS